VKNQETGLPIKKKGRKECLATFREWNGSIIYCDLTTGHGGRHTDGYVTWLPKKYIGYRIRLIPKFDGQKELRVHISHFFLRTDTDTFAFHRNIVLKGTVFPKKKAEKEAKKWREVTNRYEVRLIRVFRCVGSWTTK